MPNHCDPRACSHLQLSHSLPSLWFASPRSNQPPPEVSNSNLHVLSKHLTTAGSARLRFALPASPLQHLAKGKLAKQTSAVQPIALQLQMLPFQLHAVLFIPHLVKAIRTRRSCPCPQAPSCAHAPSCAQAPCCPQPPCRVPRRAPQLRPAKKQLQMISHCKLQISENCKSQGLPRESIANERVPGMASRGS